MCCFSICPGFLRKVQFEWDAAKESENEKKHGIGFSTVGLAWSDPGRIIVRHPGMTRDEGRFQFIGFDGNGVLTVRFTIRAGTIRVIGAGYWRKQKRLYEEENPKD